MPSNLKPDLPASLAVGVADVGKPRPPTIPILNYWDVQPSEFLVPLSGTDVAVPGVESPGSPVSLAAGVAGLVKPPPEAPEDQPSLEERERSRKKCQVLSRKAIERSRMLQKGSRRLIDASKVLLSGSNSKAIKK